MYLRSQVIFLIQLMHWNIFLVFHNTSFDTKDDKRVSYSTGFSINTWLVILYLLIYSMFSFWYSDQIKYSQREAPWLYLIFKKLSFQVTNVFIFLEFIPSLLGSLVRILVLFDSSPYFDKNYLIFNLPNNMHR